MGICGGPRTAVVELKAKKHVAAAKSLSLIARNEMNIQIEIPII